MNNKSKHTPEEYATWSARLLDDALRSSAKRFDALLCDLRRVHPDVRFGVCGKLGGEGLAEMFVQAFDALRFDERAEVTSFEALTKQALKRHELRR